MTPKDLIDRPELKIAAEWWSKALMGHFLNDTGDIVNDAFANWAGSKLDKPSQRQADQFKQGLIALMAVRFSESWKEAESNCGSGTRTLAIDYGPDHLLTTALAFCGISGHTLVLPLKTVMWVSPKSVRVRCGWSGKEVELMEAK